MFDKAYTSATMDYEIIFWGYTFAIKKITWFAQVEKEFVRGSIKSSPRHGYEFSFYSVSVKKKLYQAVVFGKRSFLAAKKQL